MLANRRLRAWPTKAALAWIALAAAAAPGVAGAKARECGERGSCLLLSSGGEVLPPGSRVAGEAGLGVCGTAQLKGRLSSNRQPIDQARFSRSDVFGGCSEGGPNIGGKIESMALTREGTLMVHAKLVYESGEIEPKRCLWQIEQLEGSFKVPGPTEAKLTATGMLLPRHSQANCPKTRKFHGNAVLTNASFEVLQAET